MFRPVISRALGPTSVSLQRIHRLLSSDGGREGRSERPKFDLGWKDIAELNEVCVFPWY